ncbi:MAG: acyl-CoA dehydrogenase [Hyphomicrobiales bacterium]
MTYTPQLSDLRHALNDIADFGSFLDAGGVEGLDRELVYAVLEEAGKFATSVLAPINVPGDEYGAKLDTETNEVTTAPGWKDAYAQWCEAGWAALPCESEHGGQGLPVSVGLAVQELWNTAANAFGIGTLLTQGAVEAIHAHGSEELQQAYLPKMVLGEWMGTMNLTEPQAGTDLAALRSKAERANDGAYRISGTKIFITHGEHDLTENIIHLVLARLPDAPEGTRGISLFLVPKFLPDENGDPGERNDLKCIGVEKKLGIHGSPTCTMQYGENGGAVGWLVGQENKGLACMFTMMNNARLHVGMQGVSIAERAYQHALAYAQDRKQGRRPGTDGMVPIIEHPDVRRMLSDMKAKTAAARAICFKTAMALDLSRLGADEKTRAENHALGGLLTPVAKAFSTDMGVDVASTGIQVFGGMGFIEETGAAQHLRDARITPIYEGTNGIQAIDLVTRKLPLGNGDVVFSVISELKDIADEVMLANDESLGRMGYRLSAAIEEFEEATTWMLQTLNDNVDRALSSATPYLRLFGVTAGGCWLAKGALAAMRAEDEGEDVRAFRVQLARYYAENHMPQARALSSTVRGGAHALDQLTPEALSL